MSAPAAARPLPGQPGSALASAAGDRASLPALLVLALIALACWNAWSWYGARVAATPEEALSLALTIAGLLAIAAGNGFKLKPVPLAPLPFFLAAYTAAHLFLPMIMVTAIAVIALLHALYRALFDHRPPAAFYALVALSLPVLPSLQFVLGYPMRVVSAALTVGLLKLQGLAIVRQGTHMVWAGEAIQFDAPCSGVNMLWASLMLTLMACTLWRSGLVMTAVALCAAIVLALTANVFRAASLFYVEAGLLTGAEPWWHEAIGLVAFAASAIATLALLVWLRSWENNAWRF